MPNPDLQARIALAHIEAAKLALLGDWERHTLAERRAIELIDELIEEMKKKCAPTTPTTTT